MYELDMPFYHMSFAYLTDDIVEEINKQLLKNIPDDDWINNILRQNNLDYDINNNNIIKIKILFNNKTIINIKIQSHDLDVVAEDIIRYICATQYTSLLEQLD